MGLFGLFKRKDRPDSRLRTVEAPSPRFPTALDAIVALVTDYRAHPKVAEDAWLTFTGDAGGKQAIIELSDDAVNFCVEQVDLPALLHRHGLGALADIARQGATPDTTLWPLPGATPDELAAVVDLAFREHFALEQGYRVRGEHQV
jgi:hypothetical protein